MGLFRLQTADSRQQTPRRRRSVAILLGCLLALVSGFLSQVSCPLVLAAEMKIGYVDVDAVFEGYEHKKAAEAMLEKKGKQKEGELAGRVDELKKLRQNLELLNDQAKEAKSHDVEQKADELQQFRNATARDLRHERDQLIQGILQEIRQEIEGYAKSNGFSLVFNKGVLLYGDSGQEITTQVLKVLNEHYAAAATKKTQ